MSEQTAQEAYEQVRDKIWQQIRQLQDHILAHQKSFDGTNWGMVGDMQHISELLRQMLESKQ